jgi:hypothetical protein
MERTIALDAFVHVAYIRLHRQRWSRQMAQHPKYEPGDQVQDIQFDPPINGVVVSKAERPDTYNVRLTERSDDVAIHARNLRRTA